MPPVVQRLLKDPHAEASHMSLQMGQRVQIDLFGMRLPGVGPCVRAEGTVVGLDPGVITVRLECECGHLSDVTVSPGRIEALS